MLARGEGSSAADMLAEALGRLGAGDRAGAGRLFEQLVAAHPEAREANHARRYLGEAYRSDPALARANAADGALDRTSPPAPGTASATPSRDAEPATTDGWRASVRAETALEHRLISEVGDRVFFSSGSAELGSRARTVLAGQAQWLKRQPRLNATIEGHADEPGSEADNSALAQARAEAVRQRLVEEGVAPERLSVASYGRDQRIAECGEPECAAQNRRTVTQPYTRERDDLPAAVSGSPAGDPGVTRRAAAEPGPSLSTFDLERRPQR